MQQTSKKRIVTHKAPDADALVAAWLAAKYLFEGQAEVVFRGRSQKVHDGDFDCVVDIGNRYDPAQLWFDHKPPAFADRNATCAAKLVWDYLVESGRPVKHLKSMVQVVYEGDTRKRSPLLEQSRIDGVHGAWKLAKRESTSDAQLYELMAFWLNCYERSKRSAED